MDRIVRTRVAHTADGLCMPCGEHGDPSGMPVLLVHGYTDSWKSFAPVLPHLPAWMWAVAPTLRGHGEADKPDGGYRLQDFAADLAGLMDRLEMPAAVVVGHSMGSAVAQRFALDYPERTAGLVLAGAFPGGKGIPAMAELRQDVVALGDAIPRAFAFEFQQSTLAQPVAEGLLDLVTGESMKVPAHVWQAAVADFTEADLAPELRRIAAPTLLLWGSRDAFFPRPVQDRLLAALPRARLRVYEGAGHALHWEEPERFADDLAVFAHQAARALAAA